MNYKSNKKNMSAKKMKSILFYLIPLGLLFAYIFTTCYGTEIDDLGTEIDDLETRVTTIEESLKEIKDKIASGKIIESVTTISGGFNIRFTDGTTYDIVNGAQGAKGDKGDEWYISAGDSLWHNQTTGATGGRAIPADGKDAKAPTINDDGYWTFYEWNSAKGAYDTAVSKMMADTALMYLVDFGDYYELYTPVQEKDAYGNPVVVTDPVTGESKIKRTWEFIKLPKYKPDPEPALFFKFIGYAKVLKGDSVVEMLTEDLELQYTFLDYVHLYNDTRPVSEDSAIWKWKRRGSGELVEDQFRIARLVTDSLAVVFSINKPREYMNLLGDPASPGNFQLRNTRNESLTALRLDRPTFFDDKGVISKVGSNNDTLYFARLRNMDPLLERVPFPSTETGKIYYRLVMNDTVRSELSPYPLRVLPVPALDEARVDKLLVPSVLEVTPSAAGIYEIPNNTSNRYQLSFTNSNLFDHYITTSKPVDSICLYPLAGDTIIKVFKVDTLLQDPGSSYQFDITVRKLQKDGIIYQETIQVRATEP
jgi:hypothetical protein